MLNVNTPFKKAVQWIICDKYNGIHQPEFYNDLKRLGAGEPMDYVIGWVPFLGCRIDLSLRPFIPRTETEYWVKHVIDESKSSYGDKPLRILDIFSGSGCIGTAVLKHLPNAEVYFAEKERGAVAQIRKNLEINNIDLSRAIIIQSDVFGEIKDKYDIIFANPPYVPLAREDAVAHSVREYEPQDAVFGGYDGLDVIRRFLGEARQHLNLGGTIWMEFDAPEKEKIGDMILKYSYASHEFFLDQFGMWRFVKIAG